MYEKFKGWKEWKKNPNFDSQVKDSADGEMNILDAAMDKAIEKMTDRIMAIFGKRCGIEGDEGREKVRKSVRSRVVDAVSDWLYSDYLGLDE